MKMTLPQKNIHRIKKPSSKLTILVSSCWENNFIRNNAHNFFILSLIFLKLLIVSVAFFFGPPCIANMECLFVGSDTGLGHKFPQKVFAPLPYDEQVPYAYNIYHCPIPFLTLFILCCHLPPSLLLFVLILLLLHLILSISRYSFLLLSISYFPFYLFFLPQEYTAHNSRYRKHVIWPRDGACHANHACAALTSIPIVLTSVCFLPLKMYTGITNIP